MSRVTDLVLDGSQVKLQLLAERQATSDLVHVDWLRFTCFLRKAPCASEDILFPLPDQSIEPLSVAEEERFKARNAYLSKFLADLPPVEFSPAQQALALADQVCGCLGEGFSVAPELRKGLDFYRHRWSITRAGAEVGWVGFLASSDSPRQSSQRSTLHCNIFGSACTFAQSGWRQKIASLITAVEGKITRVDLALDFFDGLTGGMDRIRSDYMHGGMDHWGKRPKCNLVGDWCNGVARSFYIGSKEAGKQTNVYEKGHQLFGNSSGNPWIRAELRYGNKLRVLPVDVLTRPDDFFAGASAWHESLLFEASKLFGTSCDVEPEPVKTTTRLASETVAAECARVARWAMNTAAPTLAALVKFTSYEFLAALCGTEKLPGRLKRFTESELQRAFSAPHYSGLVGT